LEQTLTLVRSFRPRPPERVTSIFASYRLIGSPARASVAYSRRTLGSGRVSRPNRGGGQTAETEATARTVPGSPNAFLGAAVSGVCVILIATKPPERQHEQSRRPLRSAVAGGSCLPPGRAVQCPTLLGAAFCSVAPCTVPVFETCRLSLTAGRFGCSSWAASSRPFRIPSLSCWPAGLAS